MKPSAISPNATRHSSSDTPLFARPPAWLAHPRQAHPNEPGPNEPGLHQWNAHDACIFKSSALICAFVIVFLSGCNGTLPPVPKTVDIPIPVPCLTREQVPAKDFLPDAELAKLDDFQLVISLRTEQLKQRGWIETTSALLEACVK